MKKGLQWCLILLGTAALCLTGSCGRRTAFEKKPEPVVIAHRGSSAEAPENSLPAFRQAILEGADWIELDVHQTKDGVAVAAHDADLNRLAGVDARIWELTFAQLQQYSVGAGCSGDYGDVRIPALEEVLRLCRGRVKLNIELKPTGHEQNLERQVAGLVSDYGMTEDCVLACQDAACLETAKRLAPELETLYVTAAPDAAVWQAAYVDSVSVSSGAADADLLESVHQSGKKLYIWTVNDAQEMKRWMLAGADGIITDKPGEALRVRDGLS